MLDTPELKRPWLKTLAEGAGKYITLCWAGRKGYRDLDIDTLVWVARWAGHWGRLTLGTEGDVE